MNLVIALLFAIFYILFFSSFLKKKASVFVLILILIIFFYEFLFIQLSPYVESSLFYLIKSWQEYLLIILTFLILARMLITNKYQYSVFEKNIFIVLAFVTIAGFLISIVQATPFFEAFLGWRTYILPFLLTFLMYRNNAFEDVSIKSVNYLIILLSVVMVSYAIYVDAHFYGDLKDLWFYEYINKLSPLEEARPNYVRENNLRATGFFVSPLIYSSFLSYTTLIIFFYLIILRKPTLKFILLIVLAVLVYGLLIARTRIGLIISALGFISSIWVYYRPILRIRKIVILALSLVAITFAALLFGLTSDLSALGRLGQYASFVKDFSLFGLGFGHKLTDTYFDSWYISTSLLFGVLFPAYLYIHYIVIKKIHYNTFLYKTGLVSLHEKVFFYSTYGFLVSFIYTFAFQYLLGSATIYFLYITSFLLISHLKKLDSPPPGDLNKLSKF